LTSASTARLIEGTETPKVSARSETWLGLLAETRELEQSLGLGHREPALLNDAEHVAAVVEEDVTEQGAESRRRLLGLLADRAWRLDFVDYRFQIRSMHPTDSCIGTTISRPQ
jgi:hypothetical protein